MLIAILQIEMCFNFCRKRRPPSKIDVEAEMEEMLRNVEIYNRITEEVRRRKNQDASIENEQQPCKPLPK